MPYIDMKLNVSLDEKLKETLKSEAGRLISTLPGKSEAWLMFQIEDGLDLYFKGLKDPAAYIEVKVYGSPSEEAFNKFTKKITDLVSSLTKIESSRIYVSYFHTSSWGYDGENF